VKWLFQDNFTCYGSAQKTFSTVLLTKDVQNQSFVVETSLNVNQELSIEVVNSSQSKVYYGSACEFLWYELLCKGFARGCGGEFSGSAKIRSIGGSFR